MGVLGIGDPMKVNNTEARIASSEFEWDTRRVFVNGYWRFRYGSWEWVIDHTRRFPRF